MQENPVNVGVIFMKKFLLFTLIILGFTILSAYMAEKTDLMGLRSMEISASFDEQDGKLTLSWDPLPYPCFYKVETYSPTTGLVEGEPESKFWGSGYTMNASYELPPSAIPMNYRVTA